MLRWKLIPEYDGFYRVSSTGRVQSCRKHGGRVAGLRGPWREMALTEDKYGYLVVGLFKDKKQKLLKVHQLVLRAFVGLCPTGLLCRHYPDQNPKNNNLENLSWATPKRNRQDRVENGTAGMEHLRGIRHPLAKLNPRSVRAVRGKLAAGIPQTVIAKELGVSQSKICKINRGQSWSHVK